MPMLPLSVVNKLARAARMLLRQGLSDQTNRLITLLQDPYDRNPHVKRNPLTKDLHRIKKDPLVKNMSPHPLVDYGNDKYDMTDDHQNSFTVPMDYTYFMPRVQMPR